MTRRFLLATRSAGKLRELNLIFAEFGLHAVDLVGAGIRETPAEDGLESFETFEENALAKARYFYEQSGGMPTFADDSGMCVDALRGQPGVYSKRWSGRPDLSGSELDDANNAKLVAEMDKARRENPQGFTDTARYVCVAVFKDSQGEEYRRGEIEGRILTAPRGAGGFGYDPYFFAHDLGRTFAESSVEKTGRFGHRGRAFLALLSALRENARLD